MPIPSLPTSGVGSFVDAADVLEGGGAGVYAVGLSASGFFNSTSSAPHFSIRSASSLAAFSASSKEIVSAIFLTASFCGFLAPSTPVLLAAVAPVVFDEDRNAAEDVVLGAAAVSTDKFERLEFADLPLFVATAPFAGLGVLPRTGGVAVREGGGVGLWTMGLSQDSKKSSDLRFSSSAKLPPMSSATTVSGWDLASFAARRLSSSLYARAALDVYFTRASLEFRAAAPPFLVKNSVAEAFPPTFMIRI